jgi:hypothetical protein
VYGFTPDETGELPLDRLFWLPLIELAAEDAERLRSDQERRMEQGRQRGISR